MPIISQIVRIKWKEDTRLWYEYKGYHFTNYRNTFKVLVKDLIPHAATKVLIKCDFCGKITQKSFYRCQNICNCSDKECIKKRKELTNLKKYGVKYAWQAPQVKLKIIEVLKRKYGVEHVSEIPFIHEKIFNIKHHNKSIATSKQQNRLCKLFNGVLNYPFSNWAIDIALVDDKIAIEYNGSGHDLSVQRNWLTQEEFEQKELERKNTLIQKKWKVITLISNNDELMTNNNLLKLLEFCKYQFNQYNKDYIIIDFDKNQIITDDYSFNIGKILRNS